MFFNVLKFNKNYLDKKIVYIVLIIFGILITIVIYNKFKSVSTKKQIEAFTKLQNKPKSIININKHKLYDTPKTVSFSLNNDVMYFNESGFLRQERERM